VLGLEVVGEQNDADGGTEQVCLRDRDSRFTLCLVGHERILGGPFDERQIGLDHVEFFVTDRDALDAWAARLDEFGVAHSGVKTPPYTANRMITFRDPDNIQLEFFWEARQH
jgi:catechol 2,3-dioxygenase-like lactoylglutathione lyase family enzyme